MLKSTRLVSFAAALAIAGGGAAATRTAITTEVSKVVGVSAVEVDLKQKVVTVTGAGFNDAAVGDAIGEAGYGVA